MPRGQSELNRPRPLKTFQKEKKHGSNKLGSSDYRYFDRFDNHVFADGFFHEKVVVADWTAVYTALGIQPPTHNTANLAYFFIFELGRGILAMALYVMMRFCWKPGPAAAALSGVVMWIAFSVTGPAQFIPLGFFSHALWFKVGAYHLVTSIIAAIAGAAVYKDASPKTA